MERLVVQSLEKAAEYTPADPAFKPLLSKAADGVERHAWLDGWSTFDDIQNRQPIFA